jgi:uncharacterized protein YjbJ (UPF0337 family)
MGEKTDRAKGQVKEKAGRMSGKAGLEEKGRAEQAKGHLKRSAKGLKDAVKKSP